MSAGVRSLFATAREDCAAIAVHLLGEPNPHASTKRQLRWGVTAKMSLTIAGPHKGKWRDFSTHEHGDICDLVEQTLSLSRTEALTWLARWSGQVAFPLDPVALANKRSDDDARAARERAAKAQYGVALFENAPSRFEGTPGLAYLQRRHSGLVPQEIIAGGSLRFCSGHRKFQGQLVPGAIGALLALMTDPVSGRPLGCHRTFIDGNLNRICRGMLGGKGVVRLFPDQFVTYGLGIGEGIESSISGHILFQGPPVWAGLDADNLGRFPVLAGVETLTIFSDNDESGTGQRGAGACATRWLDAGRVVIKHTPLAADTDFNTILEDLAVEEQLA